MKKEIQVLLACASRYNAVQIVSSHHLARREDLPHHDETEESAVRLGQDEGVTIVYAAATNLAGSYWASSYFASSYFSKSYFA